MLRTHRDELKLLSNALLEHDTLTAAQVHVWRSTELRGSEDERAEVYLFATVALLLNSSSEGSS